MRRYSLLDKCLRGYFLCLPSTEAIGKWKVALSDKENQNHHRVVFLSHGSLCCHSSIVPSKQRYLHLLALAPKGSVSQVPTMGHSPNELSKLFLFLRYQPEFCLNPDVTISVTSKCI